MDRMDPKKSAQILDQKEEAWALAVEARMPTKAKMKKLVTKRVSMKMINQRKIKRKSMMKIWVQTMTLLKLHQKRVNLPKAKKKNNKKAKIRELLEAERKKLILMMKVKGHQNQRVNKKLKIQVKNSQKMIVTQVVEIEVQKAQLKRLPRKIRKK
jgi:hypothetical protein